MVHLTLLLMLNLTIEQRNANDILPAWSGPKTGFLHIPPKRVHCFGGICKNPQEQRCCQRQPLVGFEIFHLGRVEGSCFGGELLDFARVSAKG